MAQLNAGKLPLSRADRVRARIAMLTAQHVLPIWDAEIAPVPLLLPAEIENDIRYILDVMVKDVAAADAIEHILERRRESSSFDSQSTTG